MPDSPVIDRAAARNDSNEAEGHARLDLACEHGLDPSVMALRWAMDQRFMTSVILGATTAGQLRINLRAAETTLSREVREGIEAIHREQPNAYLIQ